MLEGLFETLWIVAKSAWPFLVVALLVRIIKRGASTWKNLQ